MKDQFVPYELALKLKELLNFNQECFAAYMPTPKHLTKQYGEKWLKTHGNPFGYDIGRVFNSKLNTGIAAPLWQQAFDWFRIKHNVIGQVSNWYKEWVWELLFLRDDDIKKHHTQVLNSRDDTKILFKTYEEARQACLEKLIELI